MKVAYFYLNVVGAILFCNIQGIFGSSQEEQTRMEIEARKRKAPSPAANRKKQVTAATALVPALLVQYPLKPQPVERAKKPVSKIPVADLVSSLMKRFFFVWVKLYQPEYKQGESQCFWTIEKGVFENIKKYRNKLYFSKLDYNSQFPSQISIIFKGMPKSPVALEGKVIFDCPTFLEDKRFTDLIKLVMEVGEAKEKDYENVMELNTLQWDETKLGKLFLEGAREKGPNGFEPRYLIFDPEAALEAVIKTSRHEKLDRAWEVYNADSMSESMDPVSVITFTDGKGEKGEKGEKTLLRCNDCGQTRNLNTAAKHLVNYINALGPWQFISQPGRELKPDQSSKSPSTLGFSSFISLNQRKLTELVSLLQNKKEVEVGFMKPTIHTWGDKELKNIKLRGAIYVAKFGEFHLIFSADNGFATAPLVLSPAVNLPEVFETSPFYTAADATCNLQKSWYRCTIEGVKVAIPAGMEAFTK